MPDTAGSLPPRQQLVAVGKWPLVGERAAMPPSGPWQVSIAGAVRQPLTLGLDDLAALPQTFATVDIHCVTRWTKPAVSFQGVLLADVLALCQPTVEARFVSFVAASQRNHSTSLPVSEAIALGTLLALRCESQPLPAEHGGPVRVIAPGRYFYKSLKWLRAIELLPEDRLGFWEREAGYHNVGDPWREQRYIAPNLSRQTLQDVLARRDFSHCDLRSLDARTLDLSGLVAREALLRDADFSRCNLHRAIFDGANLSNARLAEADLRGASFVGADVEGADLSGADLREVDFRGASLLGATFCGGDAAQRTLLAKMDATTHIDLAAIEQLTPAEQAFVTRSLKLNLLLPPGEGGSR